MRKNPTLQRNGSGHIAYKGIPVDMYALSQWIKSRNAKRQETKTLENITVKDLKKFFKTRGK